jgi:dolichol-phosphate mannosyltransferase
VVDQSENPVADGVEPPAAATAPVPPLAPGARLRAGVRKPQNWVQLAKFCAVGGSGYVVNIAVFSLALKVGGLHHLVAATLAFLVAVTNNFWWNRYWTFAAGAGRAGFQAARFLAVSVVAFVFAATVLELLVTRGGVPEIPAQAISIVVATPLSFLGNKIWSFGSGDWRG